MIDTDQIDRVYEKSTWESEGGKKKGRKGKFDHVRGPGET